MESIDFPGANCKIAEGQSEYVTLHAKARLAFVTPEKQAITLTFCWRLSWRERLALLLGGKLWHSVLTFGDNLQPQFLSVERHDSRDDEAPKEQNTPEA